MDSILIHRTLLFWLALVLPGYVVVRHVFPRDLKSGLLGTIAVSSLMTWGLLSPISILCYIFHAPLWMFSAACVLAVLLAVVEITRRRWWTELGKLVVAGMSFALLIILLDMIAGVRVGTFAIGDARVHLARIRFLLDHGFSNYDPFVAAKYFFPIYHTNIHHAFYAACSQITGLDHLGVWYTSLSWGKLLVAAGAYYMTWSIFQRRWVASVAAVFVVGCQGPVSYIPYPNKLAPYWVIPVMIGFAAEACRSPCSWRTPLKLGLGSLVLGQMHGLYAAFCGLLLGLPLVVVSLIKIVRRRPDRWRLVSCAVILGVALPFVLVSKSGSRPGVASFHAARASGEASGRFVHFENGWVMHNPKRGFGREYGWRFAALTAGAVCGLVSSRRRQVGMLLAVVGTGAVILYAPPICSAVLRFVGKEWILGRLQFVLYLGFIGLVPAIAAFLIEPKVRSWWLRFLMTVAIAGIAVPFGWRSGEFSWPAYCQKVIAPQSERTEYLTAQRTNAALLAQHVPSGSTVLAKAFVAAGVVALHDCHVVASDTASNGVLDQAQRRRDLKRILARATPLDERRSLLRKYEITHYLVVKGEKLHPWLEQLGAQSWQGAGVLLIALHVD